MARQTTCDSCQRNISEENPIVAKLYFTPINGHKPKDAPSKYKAHMDIGKCCLMKVNAMGKWQKRKPRPKVFPEGANVRSA